LAWRGPPIQGPQPDTGRSCKTKDMGPVCCIVACLLPAFDSTNLHCLVTEANRC